MRWGGGGLPRLKSWSSGLRSGLETHLGVVNVDLVLKPLAWGSLRVSLDGDGDQALGLSSLEWIR